MRAHRPLSRQWGCTVKRGGKSLGSNRHESAPRKRGAAATQQV